MDPVEHELVKRVRSREPRALQEVLERFMPQVLRTARAAGLSRERAEDLTQATFITFLESLDRFEGRAAVRTWIFGILYRKLAEVRRDLRREGQHDDIEDVDETRFDVRGRWSSPPRPTDDPVFRAEIARSIDSCLQELPERHRLAFVLREAEGLGTEQLCNILECTRTNLGVMLHRARAALRACLEKRGIEGSRDAQLP